MLDFDLAQNDDKTNYYYLEFELIYLFYCSKVF